MQQPNPFSPPNAPVADLIIEDRLSVFSFAAIGATAIHSLWYILSFSSLYQLTKFGAVNLIYFLASILAAVLLLVGVALLLRRSGKAKVSFILAAAFAVVMLLQARMSIAFFCLAVSVASAAAAYAQLKVQPGPFHEA